MTGDDDGATGPRLPGLSRPLRRAEFLAVVWFGLGAAEGWAVVTVLAAGGSPDLLDVALTVGFLAIGAVYLRRPDAIRRGTDPAPRWWYGLAAAALGLLLLGVFLLGP
jgi:hypothetical protein